jgi:hypothetical protein
LHTQFGRRPPNSGGSYQSDVSGFLQIYEKKGAAFLHEHLQYEIDKYVREGLRPDYQRPLTFFSREDENSDSAAWLEKARALAEAGLWVSLAAHLRAPLCAI